MFREASPHFATVPCAEAHKRFPNQPIRAVVTTSDVWPHLAGIREYAAEGIPIYALDLNQPILNRVIADPRTSKPDALARSPRKAQFHLVYDKEVLGTGANRLEIYPTRGETSGRQMMVYFPKYNFSTVATRFRVGGTARFSIRRM